MSDLNHDVVPALARQSLSPWQLTRIVLAVILADQITKATVLSALSGVGSVTVIPSFFDVVLAFNRGVAFGMFSGWEAGTRTLILSVAICAAVGLVVLLYRTTYRGDRLGQVALGMILGGALGNLIDRARIGVVVDFLDFYIGTYHWPAFNVADSAICVGVFLLFFHDWWKARK